MTEARRRLTFIGVPALLFAGSVAATIGWSHSMSGMGDLPLAGGATMSTAWVPMCGQTWGAAGASFVAMWSVMMVAMMMPSLAPMLWRYAVALEARGEARAGVLTATTGAGYFFVWAVLGVVVFIVVALVGEAVMQVPALARALPGLLALLVLACGAFQFTPWKARLLLNCREASVPCAVFDGSGRALPGDAAAACRRGVWLGLQCAGACAGFTIVLLVIGVMDLRAMVVLAAAITAERLAPHATRVAWAVGAGAMVAGTCMLARAAGLA